jgi:hypothetical protein
MRGYPRENAMWDRTVCTERETSGRATILVRVLDPDQVGGVRRPSKRVPGEVSLRDYLSG